MFVYNRSLDAMSTFGTSGTYIWLLLQDTYVPDPAHDFIADLTGEVTVASYARVTVTGASRTVDDTNDRIVYDADDPDFGDLETTQSAQYLILAQQVTNDADSPLIYCFDMGWPTHQLGPDFIVHLHPDGFAVQRQAP